jgi:hypothetical protein
MPSPDRWKLTLHSKGPVRTLSKVAFCIDAEQQLACTCKTSSEKDGWLNVGRKLFGLSLGT